MGDRHLIPTANPRLFGIRYLRGAWRSYGIRLRGAGGSVNNEPYSDVGGSEGGKEGRRDGTLSVKGSGCINGLPGEGMAMMNLCPMHESERQWDFGVSKSCIAVELPGAKEGAVELEGLRLDQKMSLLFCVPLGVRRVV